MPQRSGAARLLGWLRGSPSRSDDVTEAPLRAELFSVTQLERHAETLARTHKVAPRSRDNQLLLRLADTENLLADAYTLLAAAVGRGRQITPAAEWFVDNYHLIEEQIRTARRHLPRGYSRELPRLADGPSPGMPRVYDLALELISHRTAASTSTACARSSPRTSRSSRCGSASCGRSRSCSGWRCSRTCGAWSRRHDGRARERERAGEWVGADARGRGDATPARGRARARGAWSRTTPPLTTAFVAELASRLQAQGPALAFRDLVARAAARRARADDRARVRARRARARRPTRSRSATASAACGSSARPTGATSSRRLSVVERDAARAIRRRLRERWTSRRATAIATSSRRSRGEAPQVPELDVARARGRARGAARRAAARRGTSATSWSIAGGRALERAVRMRRLAHAARARRGARAHCRLRRRDRARDGRRDRAASLAAAARSTRRGSSPGRRCSRSAPASSPIALVHWVATLVVSRDILPRLDFSTGIPPEHRTLVAVPTMLTDARGDRRAGRGARGAVPREPRCEPRVRAASRDSATPPTRDTLDGDDCAARSARRRRSRRSNAQVRTRARSGGCFFLFHRARRWNPREGVWMGWERKRGKLEQLNAALRGDARAVRDGRRPGRAAARRAST